MTDLADISVEALQSQIEKLQAMIDRRKEETKKATKPTPLSNPDWKHVIELCQSYLSDLDETGYADPNYYHWIFKTAMDAVFGNDIWEWTNPILRGE